MKKKLKKLTLHRETLRHLSQPELTFVAGGICTAAPCGYPTFSKTTAHSECTNDCCTDECTVECETVCWC